MKQKKKKKFTTLQTGGMWRVRTFATAPPNGRRHYQKQLGNQGNTTTMYSYFWIKVLLFKLNNEFWTTCTF